MFDVEWVLGMTDNELCVAPGDVVNFNFEDGHNIEATTQEAYEACDATDHNPVQGPLSWTAPAEEGVTYVICGVGLHCSLGNQKIAITTSNSC